MRVKINRDVCSAHLAFCERCLGQFLKYPLGYERRRASRGVLTCRIPRLPLHSGEYGVSVWLADMYEDYDAEIGVLTFHFASPDFRPEIPPVAAIGPMNVLASWRLERTAESVAAS